MASRRPRGTPYARPTFGGTDHRDKFRNRPRGSTFRRPPDRNNQQQQQSASATFNFKKANFYCCSCERGFKTKEQYEEHNKEHIVCGLDGCQFEAHSLVVTKHIRIQHEGNLFHRLKNLNTPEDIQRWRQERMKNYPKLGTAEEKEKEKKEKEERREVFGAGGSQGPSNPFCYRIPTRGDPRDFDYTEALKRLYKTERNQSGDWMKRSYAPDMKFPNQRVPFFSLNKSKVLSLETFYLSVKHGNDGAVKKEKKVKWKGFKANRLDCLPDSDSEDESAMPISDEEDYYDQNDEESDTDNPTQGRSDSGREAQVAVVDSSSGTEKPCTGLSLVDYSSASESESENEDNQGAAAASGVSASGNETANTGVAEIQSSVVDTTAEECAKVYVNLHGKPVSDYVSDSESEDEEDVKILEFEEDAVFKDKPTFSRVNVRRTKWSRRPQLLETLLQDQIRKERNALLQVCRFVTDNNFFGVQ